MNKFLVRCTIDNDYSYQCFYSTENCRLTIEDIELLQDKARASAGVNKNSNVFFDLIYKLEV